VCIPPSCCRSAALNASFHPTFIPHPASTPHPRLTSPHGEGHPADLLLVSISFHGQTDLRYQTVSKFPFHWWGANSTLPGRHQLDEPPGLHSAQNEVLDVPELRYANSRGCTNLGRSASFPAGANKIMTRFVRPRPGRICGHIGDNRRARARARTPAGLWPAAVGMMTSPRGTSRSTGGPEERRPTRRRDVADARNLRT
jgi:hypothetical protein